MVFRNVFENVKKFTFLRNRQESVLENVQNYEEEKNVMFRDVFEKCEKNLHVLENVQFQRSNLNFTKRLIKFLKLLFFEMIKPKIHLNICLPYPHLAQQSLHPNMKK